MKRLDPRRYAGGVSLFPFLAVLICTMGALIVLLVLVVKQAEVQAKQEREADVRQRAEAQRRLRIELEDQELLRTTLQSRRPEMTRRLADHRLELAHLEDHIRQLKHQAEQVQQQLDDLEHIDDLRQQDRHAAETELATLRRAIEAARKQLAQAQQRAAHQPRSFAIIPYEGPNGTTRRPIYIECTGRAVIIQPEGVALQAGDFREPLVPGNPLDAALLAIRQYLARAGLLREGDEPYPLLIVRPGGAEAYAKVRAAMKSWEDEFGYELIDEEMHLKYPPPDPALEKVIRQAIDEARQRQAALAAAQPSRFSGAPTGEGTTFLGARPDGGGFSPDEAADGQPSASRAQLGFDAGQEASFKPDGASEDGPAPNRPADSVAPLPAGSGRNDGAASCAGPPGSGTSVQALAGSRGPNWALPSRASGAIAFTRPIRVVCFADRLVVVPPRGSDQRPYVTPLPGSTRAAIDQFISSVWKHMEGWGIAGRAAYWKPVLKVEVAPGAQQRFEDLQSLLRGSGLQVVRKQ